jgi:hypothetical protein
MTSPSSPNEDDFTPVEKFNAGMLGMMMDVRSLGIDPDSMLKCSEHGELMFDPDNNFEPTEHYQHKENP